MREEYDGDDGAVNRRARLTLGGVAALVLAGVLVAPVVIGSGGGSSSSCSTALYYSGHPYSVRSVRDNTVVQARAIGVGVTRGCGTRPENVDIRSVAGVRPAVAVAVAGDPSSIYVRRGVCPSLSGRALLACVKR
jgi:hypothetical protein